MIGRVVTLRIERFGPPGAFLDAGRDGLLLPGAEIPEDAQVGDEVEVFVYRDSEDRLIATTTMPKVELGEVAFLEVKELTKIGAFVDWGLPKDLLVPFSEQTADMHVGRRYAIGLYLDDSDRLAGTMRVSEMLKEHGEFELDEWVEGEAWRDEPHIGLFVIVERRFVGLVPTGEPHRLARGDRARFRVSNVLMDGKIELSLRGPAHEEMDKDAEHVFSVLAKSERPITDKASPEEIRASFGLSKKAFKRAVGRLLKTGRVTIDDAGKIHPRAR